MLVVLHLLLELLLVLEEQLGIVLVGNHLRGTLRGTHHHRILVVLNERLVSIGFLGRRLLLLLDHWLIGIGG
mgnify:CR=1